MANDERVLDPQTDAAALKALTHPLRLRLLGLLRQNGPATASELAELTGERPASTSYHLRVLAKYAFVHEAVSRNRRERRWESVHAVTTWDSASMSASSAHRSVLSRLRRNQLSHLETSIIEHEADVEAARLNAEWAGHAGISDWMPRMTPESLGELWQVIEQTIDDLVARDEHNPRAETVMVLAAGLPLAPSDRQPDAQPSTAVTMKDAT